MQANTNIVKVDYVETRKGVSKTGKAYEMTVCQCMVDLPQEDGTMKKSAAELVLPKDHPVISEGIYVAHFGVSISQDKKMGGRVTMLTPAPKNIQNPAASPKP